MPVPDYSPRYSPSSPYRFTRVVSRYMAYYVHRPIDPHEFDREFVIRDHRYVHRPDILADDIYNDSELWWIIPVRNGLQDPVFDIEFGKTLMIPDPGYVRSLI